MKFLIHTLLTTLLLIPTTTLADFGDQSFGWSSTESADFRDYAVRALNRQGQLINDHHLAYWLEQAYLDLNLSSQDPIGPTIILPIRDRRINAFAMPGNLIGINSGLFLSAEDQAELASVIAHEMAHIGLDHFSRIQQDNKQQLLTIAGGVLLTILLAGENPEAANATLLSSLAISRQDQLSFSRAMETEADQLAQEILINADLDPEAGRRFFRRLDELSASGGQLEFLRSHPLGRNRASNLSGRSYQPAPSAIALNAEFELLGLSLQKNLSPRETQERQKSILSRLESTMVNTRPSLRLIQARLTDSAETYRDELTRMIQLYPDFFPAYVDLLAVADSDRCETLAEALKIKDRQLMTLDALDVLTQSAQECAHPQWSQLHAQMLWQSGREEAALQFLKDETKTTKDTAQSARLSNQLKLYSRRYARFN
ncbi:M48 family metallopeptidase [Reinekea blandensis]|uniref:Peptidase M48, Ste24p:Tetratricopeptide TPR_4 n=1 Tax=Reinekea blandensis MED297 TaxID=314283 RepID=A4BHX1_9GAMM|nr:M48 family metalloprotease [Reinekea blandensis]EAR08243.1 Peptidase M48, Ste24p:Tetratricopeptide TPR_4 [Reinekea sp. MED297] [Reinekea blandensis MED297]